MARRHRLNYELKLADGKVIEQVSKFELLGFTAFSKDLKWNKQVEKATASAYRHWEHWADSDDSYLSMCAINSPRPLFWSIISTQTTSACSEYISQLCEREVFDWSGCHWNEMASCPGEVQIQHDKGCMEVDQLLWLAKISPYEEVNCQKNVKHKT